MWWDLALNPRVVLAYYSQPPQLLGIEIHSVRLHRDGPTLELQTEIPCFPDKPSPRWPAAANAVQAGLRFFDLKQVTIEGWETTNLGDLILEAEGRAVRFRFECPTARIAGLAGFFDVTGILGYCKEATDAQDGRGD